MANEAERAIVRDGETGFVAQTAQECTRLLETLLTSADLRQRMARNAIDYAASCHTPAQSARDLTILWLGLLATPARRHDFRQAIGESPADWFLSTQDRRRMGQGYASLPAAHSASKGTLAHFESVFQGDASLLRLRA